MKYFNKGEMRLKGKLSRGMERNMLQWLGYVGRMNDEILV